MRSVFVESVSRILSLIIVAVVTSDDGSLAQSNHIVQSNEESESRSSRSYIGIGGNIGFSGGKDGLGEGGIALVSNWVLNDFLSLRGVTIFSDSLVSTTALTIDFPIGKPSAEAIQFIPFIGGGILLTNKDYDFGDTTIDGLVTAGMDMRLSSHWMTTINVNVGLRDETDVGVVLGVGYSF
jgi:hypothetical protein